MFNCYRFFFSFCTIISMVKLATVWSIQIGIVELLLSTATPTTYLNQHVKQNFALSARGIIRISITSAD
jgi:hypothetical protein